MPTDAELSLRVGSQVIFVKNDHTGRYYNGQIGTIVDLEKQWTVDPQAFVSKGKNNPFGGYRLYGAVECTIVDGQIKYKA